MLYPPKSSRALKTTDGHVNEFQNFFNELRSRWVKVERLQEYDESDFEGYRAFKRGNYSQASRLVQEMVKGQTEVYSHVQRFGVQMVRVRIYDLPLSPYLIHYEIPAYLADIECGEDIRFIHSKEIDELLVETGLSDYVLYDDKRVTAIVYDLATATVKEVLLNENPDVVAEYVALSDQLIARSTPMLESDVYQTLNEQYHWQD